MTSSVWLPCLTQGVTRISSPRRGSSDVAANTDNAINVDDDSGDNTSDINDGDQRVNSTKLIIRKSMMMRTLIRRGRITL